MSYPSVQCICHFEIVIEIIHIDLLLRWLYFGNFYLFLSSTFETVENKSFQKLQPFDIRRVQDFGENILEMGLAVCSQATFKQTFALRSVPENSRDVLLSELL